jgi:uncharacterized protein (DUF983 family)
MNTREIGLGTMVKRALRRRCPVCGGRDIFASWAGLKERCPTCGYRYYRENGYWVSAIIVNTAVIESIFGIMFIAIVLATAPEVEWGPLLILGAVTNLLFPIFFYPLSKTVWVAIDLYVHPAEITVTTA